jgi:hypothetical protein
MQRIPLAPQEIRELRRRRRALAARMGRFDSLSQGSVMPQPPNSWRWTRKVRAKTVSRGLSATQAALMRQAIQNQRQLDEIIDELREITQKLILATPEPAPNAAQRTRPKTSLS